jgi:PAS domain S-box-containing protein
MNFEVRLRTRAGSYHWTNVRAIPAFSPAGAVFKFICLNLDVRERKRAEEIALRKAAERQGFLLQLSDELRGMLDTRDIQRYVARMLASHLEIDRALCAEVLAESKTLRVYADHAAPGLASAVGDYRFDEFQDIVAALGSGQVLAVCDSEVSRLLGEASKSMLRTLDIRAFVAVPMLCEEQLSWTVTVATRNVHNWTQDEITLVEEVAERTWTGLERARAETALRESELRFRRVFSNNMVPMAIWTVDGRIEDANDAMLLLTGHTRAELSAGRIRWDEMTPPEGRERDALAVAESTERGHCTPYEKYFRHSSGRLIPILIGGGQFDDQTGSGVLFAVDLSHRKHVEDSLRISEERLRLAIETAHFGVHSYDVPGDRLWWAPELYTLTGVPADQPLSLRTIEELVHPEDRQRIMRAIRASLEPAGPGLFAEEFRINRADNGEIRWLVNRARTLFDTAVSPRCPVRVVGIVMDVTERRQVEEALRRADRQKDEFLAMLGHELRNPLAPIRNAGDLLARLTPHDPRAAAPIAMLRRQSRQLAKLVDDLLDVSRIARGRVELHPETLEVNELMEQALEAVEPVMQAKRQLLQFSRATPCHVFGDRTRLVQCLGNILHNAAKYTEPGGEIDVTIDCHPEFVELRVHDTGCGIAPELLEHIFDLFVQGERTPDRAQGGLGIGLSVVKRLLNMHHGEVRAYSPGPGQGSTFVVRLPRTARRDHAAEAQLRSEAGRALSVLIVDDNSDAADAVAQLLRLSGHRVEAAYSSLTALEAAERLQPDAIVLDVGLPHLDGYEVARRLRGNPATREAFIIGLTGYGQPEDIARAREAGFDDYLIKPADPDRLDELLSTVAATDHH